MHRQIVKSFGQITARRVLRDPQVSLIVNPAASLRSVTRLRDKGHRGFPWFWVASRGIGMAGDSSDGRAGQTLKHAVGMAAAAGAYKGLQLTWKQATGKEPPLGPDDQHATLGRAIVWTLVMGRPSPQRA
jgi:uncharacterized protein DUF4235